MTQLCQYSGELDSLGVVVLLISFSSLKYGKRWLGDVCADFELLIDRAKQTYRAYGLSRSLIKAWGPKNLRRHAQLIKAGRKFSGIQGDSAQMGGDFVIDSAGIIRYAYKSRDPTDRPSAENLLAVLLETVAATSKALPRTHELGGQV